MTKTIFQDTGLPPEVCQIIADEMAVPSRELALIIKNIGGEGEGYAVRDADVPILREAALLVANFLVSPFSAWAPVAVAHLVILLYEYRKNRIPISAFQAAVLRELKSSPSQTAAEIAESLNMKDIDSEKVVMQLNAMTSVRRDDGVSVALVSADAKDRWSAQGV